MEAFDSEACDFDYKSKTETNIPFYNICSTSDMIYMYVFSITHFSLSSFWCVFLSIHQQKKQVFKRIAETDKSLYNTKVQHRFYSLYEV